MHEPSSPVTSPNSPAPESLSGAPPLTAQSPTTQARPAPWPLPLRITFRFCFVYLGLFCLTSQIFIGMFSAPSLEIPEIFTSWPLRQMIAWTAFHVFGVHRDLVFTGSGSGDKTTDWVLVFILLLIAIVATAVWSLLDRKRYGYSRLHAWFRLFVRFALAGQLIGYGMVKAFPLQMAYPNLTRMIEPFGNFSAMGVLWASIGASPAYERFAGCAELAAGILLLIPRTTLLGALIAMADMTQVFMLNMTYDVPVKIVSFHLLLLSLFLVTPDLTRLIALFFQDKPIPISAPSPIFRTRRAATIGVVVQFVYGAFLLGSSLVAAYGSWYEYGGGATKPPLYGIWEVEEYSIDGQVRQPLITEKERWRRLVVDSSTLGAVQLMDDSITYCTPKVDITTHRLVLSSRRQKTPLGQFTFAQPDPAQLTLDGEVNSHKVRARLRLFDDSNKFLLRTAKFHWINEYPFNR